MNLNVLIGMYVIKNIMKIKVDVQMDRSLVLEAAFASLFCFVPQPQGSGMFRVEFHFLYLSGESPALMSSFPVSLSISSRYG